MSAKQSIDSIFPKLFLFLVIVTILAIAYQITNSASINVMAQTTTKPSSLPSLCNSLNPTPLFTTVYKGWNFDPNNLLGNPLVNPYMRIQLLEALKTAYDNGLSVKIANGKIGAYRTDAQSDAARANAAEDARLNNQNPRAVGSGGNSCHNYGLCVDIAVYDPQTRKPIENGWIGTGPNGEKNWYEFYKKLKYYYGILWL